MIFALGVWGLARVAKKEVPKLLTKEEKKVQRSQRKELEKKGIAIQDDDPVLETREVVMMNRDFTALR